MGQLIKLVLETALEADKVLAEAAEEGLTDAIVLGWSADGSMYIKTSCKDGPHMLWLLEQARDVILMEGRMDD
jgi:hypothetical protein